jgi:hypothetical protein
MKCTGTRGANETRDCGRWQGGLRPLGGVVAEKRTCKLEEACGTDWITPRKISTGLEEAAMLCYVEAGAGKAGQDR